MRAGYVEPPEGWTRLGGRGLGPFVTREVFRRPDGTQVVWESRWHRKHPTGAPATHIWWAPRAIAWWIGVLFAIGSVCFALGSFPLYATKVGTDPDNLTYFIGSIFFTTAAFLQYHEAASSSPTLTGPHRRRLRGSFRLQHHRIDWWASLIQFVGHVVVQPHDLQRLGGRPRRRHRSPPGLAARRIGFGVLPRLELAGLGGGVPRLLRLAPRQLSWWITCSTWSAPSPSGSPPWPPT